MREGCGREAGEAREVIGRSLEYLEKRREQISYGEFELMGIPVGSGIVESANKLLVEERLKGSGMHWAERNVSPMLALRTIAFNARWEEAWPQIVIGLRAQRSEAARARRKARRMGTQASTQPPVPVGPAADPAVAGLDRMVAELPLAEPKEATKPAPDHPWRRFRFGRSLQPLLLSVAISII